MTEDKIKKIFSIGYGDKDFDTFITLLEKARIQRVVDVRSFPKSKWSEYRKENLKKNLPSQDIEYFHLKELGGYRDQGYEEYMKTEKFQKALNKLEKLAKEKKTVIMCLEPYPRNCHRRYIIEKFVEKGWKIVNLVDEKGKQKTLN